MEGTSVHLDAALEYADAGLPVFPVYEARRSGACSCGNKKCPNPGKHPRVKWRTEATTDEKKIKAWWKKWPRASIGGAGGAYFCFDIDPKSDGGDSLADLIAEHGPLPDTAVALTGQVGKERGTHYWFQSPSASSSNGKVRIGTQAGARPGIDIRGEGGYAVLPPSRHYSGVEYEWITPFSEAAEAPAWLIELAPEARAPMKAQWEPKGTPISAEVLTFLDHGGVPSGAQRHMLTRAARSLLGNGVDPEDVAERLWEALLKCDWDPDKKEWAYEDCVVLVDSLLANPPPAWEEDVDYNLTDWGNAERLIAFMEGNIRYVPEWGKWYVWTGDGKWHESFGEEVMQEFKRCMRSLTETALKLQDHDRRNLLVKHALRSESAARTEAATKLARAEQGVMLKQGELNADPMLLNVQNGVIDLTTGELKEHRREHLMTKQCSCEYNPDAKSKVWDKVLKDALPDKALREFLQKAFGYSLTASTEEQMFFYFYGVPATGKSTILEAFKRVMGNYSEVASAETFMAAGQVGNGPTEGLARLANARLVIAPEVERGSRLAEASVSRLTGQDTVTCRFLHQQSFTYIPKFKLFFAANHKPNVSGDINSGIWRRIQILPFVHRVERPDKAMPHRLSEPAAREAILAWAVEGCLMWAKDRRESKGLVVPSAVEEAVEEYQIESDPVAEFVRDCLVEKEGSRVKKQDVYDAYDLWCEKSGRKQRLTSQTLSHRLTSTGFESKVARIDNEENPTRCWVNVALKPLGTRLGD